MTNRLVTNPLTTTSLVTNSLATNGLVTNGLVTDSLVTNRPVTNGLVIDSLVTDSGSAPLLLLEMISSFPSVVSGERFLRQVDLELTRTGEDERTREKKTGERERDAGQNISPPAAVIQSRPEEDQNL